MAHDAYAALAMIVMLMGVSGSGKSTIARELARITGWLFIEADDFHPPANIEKMRSGRPLTDEDRQPWLERLAEEVRSIHDARASAVLACSALRRAYRDAICAGRREDVLLAYLDARPETLRERMQRREHFMPPQLLESQIALLEPPAADERALHLDVELPVHVLVARIVEELRRLGAVPEAS